MNSRKPLVQFSIAELVTVLTIGCLIVGAIWAPWIFVEWLFFLAMMFALSALVIAFLGRNEARFFSVGFSVLLIGYLTLSLIGQAKVLNIMSVSFDALPTTTLWEQAYETIKQVSYKNEKEGTYIASSLEPQMDQLGVIRDKDGNRIGVVGGTGGGFSSGAKIGGNTVPVIRVLVKPSRGSFRTVGEVFWMLLFGYLGGKFAIGFRRYQDRQSIEPKPQDSHNPC